MILATPPNLRPLAYRLRNTPTIIFSGHGRWRGRQSASWPRSGTIEVTLEPSYAQTGRNADRDVDDKDDRVNLRVVKRIGGDELTLEHQFRNRDRRDERGILEERDEVVSGRRYDNAPSLRQDDVAHRLPG